jgi:hypothetical protein
MIKVYYVYCADGDKERTMIEPSFKWGRILATAVIALVTLLALAVSGFAMTRLDDQASPLLRPDRMPAQQLTNVIRNGDFEQNPQADVADHWEPFDNGQAHYGWYMEQWPEAVHSGRSAQLMEIYEVYGYAPGRIMGIYQTVEVVPNSIYSLTIHALMRSDAPEPDRNKDDYAMRWGVDYGGSDKYFRVENWVTMPLTEQLRLGSAGPAAEAQHLFYERITGQIFTGDSRHITLFITGEKVTFSGTEVNFNVDDVSLIGPYPLPPTPTPVQVNDATQEVIPAAAVPNQTPIPPAGENNMPNAGARLPGDISIGVVGLGGLVVVVIGLAATVNLLARRKK